MFEGEVERTFYLGEKPSAVADLVVEKATSATSKPETAEPVYWLTPVKAMNDETAEECIEKLVGKERIFAFGIAGA
jgi:hypothetical protein